MSRFQNESKDLLDLENLLRIYYSEFILKPEEEAQRANPTRSEDTARRGESDSKILRFEEQTRKRFRKVLLKEINRVLTRIEEQE